jgi:hypothetical protein
MYDTVITRELETLRQPTPDRQERHYHQYQREINRRSCDISDIVCQELQH